MWLLITWLDLVFFPSFELSFVIYFILFYFWSKCQTSETIFFHNQTNLKDQPIISIGKSGVKHF